MARRTGGVPLWAWGVIGLCALVALAGVGVIGYLFYGHFDVGRAAGEAPRAVEVYRKAGMPWVASDLAPRPPVRPEENAAPLIRQAIARFDLKGFNRVRKELEKLAATGDPAATERRLVPYTGALTLAAKASERRRLDFGRDWDRGPNLLLPEYAPIKGIVQALAIRARLRARRQDVQGTLADLRTGRRLSVLVSQEPGLIPLLVRIAGDRIILYALQDCAASLASNPAALESLRKVVTEPRPRISLPFALRGEAYMGIAATRNLDLFGGWRAFENPERIPPPDPKRLRRSGLPPDQTARAYMTRNLQVWTEAKREMDRHPDDPVALTKALDHIVQRVEAERAQSNLLNRILFPVFGKAGDAVVVAEANATVTRAFLDALLHRARRGSFPARLADLPGEWRDPFGDGPLRLKRVGGGIRIYSLGANRRDDGGVDSREVNAAARERKEHDIVAAYPPVKPAP